VSTNINHLRDVPLEALFGSHVSNAARLRLLEAGERIEALPSLGAPHWWWDPWVSEDERQVSLLSTNLTGWKGLDDWLEFDIELDRTPGTPPAMQVEAAVGVACQCETNHQMHWVHRVTWAAETIDAAANALEAASEVVTRWFQDPGDANRWREWAGLPSGRA
jgi:hypothetical protein